MMHIEIKALENGHVFLECEGHSLDHGEPDPLVTELLTPDEARQLANRLMEAAAEAVTKLNEAQERKMMEEQSKQAAQRERELERRARRTTNPPLAPVFSTQVAGVSFIDGYPKTLLDMQGIRMANPRETMWLTLRRNPDNEYDSNAVQVIWDGHMIGHLNKVIAARLAPELDSGVEWLARVEDIVGDDQLVGCSIRLKRKD